jgi:uncharacterized protein YicC (UPF0701 family)
VALNVVVSAAIPTRFVLLCDPAIQAANGEETCRVYAETRDGGALSIPDNATWVEARALSKRSVALHDLRAAREPEGDDISRGLARLEAIAADVIETISDFPDLVRGAQGYPVARLYERLDGAAVISLVSEVVDHVARVSTLGKSKPSP